MDWPSEIERMISGYKSAIEVIREVAAEGTDEAAAQLKPNVTEVFDLHRGPLEAMWGSLSAAQ